MRRFQHIFNYKTFEEAVITQLRYCFDSESEEFLETVKETGKSRIIDLPEGTVLFRARLGHVQRPTRIYKNKYLDFPFPLSKGEMTPLLKSAREGRVNSKGIPCLYLADKPATAMSEVRPWLDACVSLGQFKTVRNLRLMNCTTDREDINLGDIAKTYQPHFEEHVWGEISHAFSKPVTATDVTAEYAPTQILAEIFKNMGCDGIKYKSLLGEKGCSYALFHLHDAKLFACGLQRTTHVEYKFADENVGYTMTPDGTEIVRDIGEEDDEAN